MLFLLLAVSVLGDGVKEDEGCPALRDDQLVRVRLDPEEDVLRRPFHAEFQPFYATTDWESPERFLVGYTVEVGNPLHLSAHPPSPEGCGERSRARDTAAPIASCRRVAVSAGFFDTRTGRCYGHLVSGGRVVQTAEPWRFNAHFGLFRNGSIFVGYVRPEEVREWPFKELVGGVLWLIKDGRSFFDQSIRLECGKTQETGSLREFAEVKSARVILGHDERGQVKIIVVEGKTRKFGATLKDMEILAISQGLVNAVNLDGGGSAALLLNSTLLNLPTDSW
ncbi:unnamed protein product [Darwinula stevensoni]|uniref:Phosphodiester glycosidase domain-containing protein n=1 Tax=Darwinula stevensoni TaxID=69355 RepID=A0A7R9A566_9CRUS|nr:unnamed protein product [Darwinula stevensoni]CAG0891438.1 unnamed protein product [Darwinula stevensoni]